MKFEHGGKSYATTEAKSCDSCTFFWRDGGLYDACEHPNQEIVKNTCGKDQRATGNNVIWMPLKPWMTLDHCPECKHKRSQHDMNCIECCPVTRGESVGLEGETNGMAIDRDSPEK
ncbi:hypothetical protein UFOVP1155_49 [uncultured Caudovirales phage]|uniref:Uncharacterized protein n=1 Tax=uncultured Caudovirales phage TaxID=2100421 RepID=A0A6J5QST8_9CAUD|nr:hypothetical protein UFOVP1155_49 [uncultured Caudovirales phage]